jgi:hypothetical protein
MSCCGKRRQAFKAWLAPRPIRLRFLGEGTAEIKGAGTGKPYVFSENAREIEVDPRDAKQILQSAGFALA